MKMIEKKNETNHLVMNVNEIINFQHNQQLNLNEKPNRNLAIAWINLTVSKKSLFSKKTTILDNINGQINFGTLTAIIGPSGVGKTTLLSCINGLNQSDISNDSLFYVSKTKSIRQCFIVQEQKEHLLMRLTVKESLMYSSKLKNYQIRKYKYNHEANIERILNDMLLNECKDNLVGLCSGGEQKRLSIAMELTSIVKPNLLCIDEPTSGLDSHAAKKVSRIIIIIIITF